MHSSEAGNYLTFIAIDIQQNSFPSPDFILASLYGYKCGVNGL